MIQIKTIKATASYDNTFKSIWSNDSFDYNIDDYKIKIDNEGDILVDVDYYGIGEKGTSLGSGRSGLYKGLSLKGIGKTPLCDEDRGIAYSSGIQNETGSIYEVGALLVSNHIFSDSIAPIGIISQNEIFSLNLHNDGEIQPMCFKGKQTKSILVREPPSRITHYLAPNENGFNSLDLIKDIKTVHNLETENLLEIVKYYISLVTHKRIFATMMRFVNVDSTTDNIDIYGNWFDLPVSGISLGLTNARVNETQTQYDVTVSSIERIIIFMIYDIIKPKTEVALECSYVISYLLGRYDIVANIEQVAQNFISTAKKNMAPVLFGLSFDDVARIKNKIGSKTFDKKMKFASQYIFSDITSTTLHEYINDNSERGYILDNWLLLISGNYDINTLKHKEKRLLKHLAPIFDELTDINKTVVVNMFKDRVTMYGTGFSKNIQGFSDPIRQALVYNQGTDATHILNACKNDLIDMPMFDDYFNKQDIIDDISFSEADEYNYLHSDDDEYNVIVDVDNFDIDLVETEHQPFIQTLDELNDICKSNEEINITLNDRLFNERFSNTNI